MDDLSIALAATRSTCKPWFINNYVGGYPKTIKYREPTSTALWYMTIRSWDFAKSAGCSTAAARRRLTELVEGGMLIERDRISGVRGWTPNKPDAERIAREIIAELRADGLPFDDEWRAAGMPKTWPAKDVSNG